VASSNTPEQVLNLSWLNGHDRELFLQTEPDKHDHPNPKLLLFGKSGGSAFSGPTSILRTGVLDPSTPSLHRAAPSPRQQDGQTSELLCDGAE
jgi:hypothetical protein